MYLSRVEVDSDNRQKVRDLTHLGAYHSWVEDSFPDETDKTERSRKLWRLDRLNGRLYLLIVSEIKPDLNLLLKYGVPGTAETKDYDPFLEKIENGRKYRFKAVLNPVYSVPMGEDKRGRVFPEITVEKQMEFFAKRASKYGFSLIEGEYTITDRRFEVLKKQGMKPVHLCKVTYEGNLTVIDTDAFRETLTKGFGKKKAYGFGMMTVIPEEK